LQRLERRNLDLEWIAREPNTDAGTVDLYQRYLRSRHPGGGMDDATLESFVSFLIAEWCPTRFFEIRQQDVLLGVAVTDDLDNSWSSVYTFFEPEQSPRGLGNWAIVQQIAAAAKQSRAWVYLGYWIRECRKMTYKSRFRPHQKYVSGRWV
jgi:arginine-tRNA-protein transferase